MLCYLIVILNFFIDRKIKSSCLLYQDMQIIWNFKSGEHGIYYML